MTPMFTPTNNAYGPPKVVVAAVDPLADEGLRRGRGRDARPRLHDREVRPGSDAAGDREGLAKSGATATRSSSASRPSWSRARTSRSGRRCRTATAKQIAFYGSTRAYKPVLDAHGWGDLQGELNRLSSEGEWDAMGEEITDEILEAFAVVAEPSQVAGALKSPLGRAGRPRALHFRLRGRRAGGLSRRASRGLGLTGGCEMLPIAHDYRDEVADLHAFFSTIEAEDWERETRFMDWTPWDVVAHLHFFDDVSLHCTHGEEGFAPKRKELMGMMGSGRSMKELQRDALGHLSAGALLEQWRDTAFALAAELGELDPKARLPLVRPRHGRLDVHDRTIHGDLGPRPGDLRPRGRRTDPHRSDPEHRRDRLPDLRLDLRESEAGAAGTAARVAVDCALGRGLGVRGPLRSGARREDRRGGARFLPHGDAGPEREGHGARRSGATWRRRGWRSPSVSPVRPSIRRPRAIESPPRRRRADPRRSSARVRAEFLREDASSLPSSGFASGPVWRDAPRRLPSWPSSSRSSFPPTASRPSISSGTAPAIAEIASAIETAGFDACFVTEHPFPTDEWLGTGGHHALDPFVSLAIAAGATSTLRLHTNLLVLSYRNPFLTAKAIASLDAASGGRVIMGVGAGYLEGEFAALGADFGTRNDVTDEAIVAMKAAWTGETVAMKGERFEAAGNTMQPPPVQRPHPPIWIGGNSPRARRRTVDFAQGWSPCRCRRRGRSGPGRARSRTSTIWPRPSRA